MTDAPGTTRTVPGSSLHLRHHSAPRSPMTNFPGGERISSRATAHRCVLMLDTSQLSHRRRAGRGMFILASFEARHCSSSIIAHPSSSLPETGLLRGSSWILKQRRCLNESNQFVNHAPVRGASKSAASASVGCRLVQVVTKWSLRSNKRPSQGCEFPAGVSNLDCPEAFQY